MNLQDLMQGMQMPHQDPRALQGALQSGHQPESPGDKKAALQDAIKKKLCEQKALSEAFQEQARSK